MIAESISPPGYTPENQTDNLTPVDNDRSFLLQQIGVISAYDALIRPFGIDRLKSPASVDRSEAYEKYMRMHKVMVGKKGARELLSIHDTLKSSAKPELLVAAGSAACEAALALEGESEDTRMEILHSGAISWLGALATQKVIVQQRGGQETRKVHRTAPLRTAINLAVMPLYEGLIKGDVSKEARDMAFEDALFIAQNNAKKLKKSLITNVGGATGEYNGFGYECNALLALNRIKVPAWIAVPSMARCDSGEYYRNQTHDIQVIHHSWGRIKDIMPVEVKATAKRHDEERYRALLMRGRMNLSAQSSTNLSSETLDIFTACHEGRQTSEQQRIAAAITGHFIGMMNEYKAGPKLPEFAAVRTRTTFRSKEFVKLRVPVARAA